MKDGVVSDPLPNATDLSVTDQPSAVKRLTVQAVLRLLAYGATTEDVVRESGYLTAGDVRACLLYAARMVEANPVRRLSNERDNSDAVRDPNDDSLSGRLLAIARETGPLFVAPFDVIEHGDMFYDEYGLPD